MEDVFPPLAKILDVVSIVTAALAIITVFVEVTAPRSAGRAVQLQQQQPPRLVQQTGNVYPPAPAPAAPEVSLFLYQKAAAPVGVDVPHQQQQQPPRLVRQDKSYATEVVSTPATTAATAVPAEEHAQQESAVGQMYVFLPQLPNFVRLDIPPEEAIVMRRKRLAREFAESEKHRPPTEYAKMQLSSMREPLQFPTGVISVQEPEGE